jgi:predicted enzyme related to lactoylglutathione lyase
VKIHLNLLTTDLAKSVQFYSVLLNTVPQKVLSDYALFVTEQPGLELALDLVESTSVTSDAHYGVCVDTVEDVERAIHRLESAGLTSAIEREQTCCYANQTKVWATDPMGRRWEVYAVHAETEERDTGDTTCCTDASDDNCSCCAA